MKWHQKSPWNFKANKVYANYRPIINTMEDQRNMLVTTSKNKKMPTHETNKDKEEGSIY